MKKLLIASCLVALTGCSSMAELRSKPPAQEFKSNKSAVNVAQCILMGWQNKSQTYGSVFIQDMDKGKTVYTASQLEVADVTEVNGDTTVKFYHQGGLFSYRLNGRIEVINNCL